jgi:hypothetical protein
MFMNTRGLFRVTLAALLAVTPLPARAADEARPPANGLQIQVVEGEGAVHVAGRRSMNPLVVQVSDETGRPVEGVAVSFRMPSDGPAGQFASGLATDVLITGADGRVRVIGIAWAETTGPVRIRITAVRGNARAGTVSEQYVGYPGGATGPISMPDGPAVSKPRGKWIAFALIAAGAAAGGLALGLSTGAAQTAPAPGTAGGQSTPPVQVGAPTITIGGP